eukprot:2697748-Pyramimonas_sp.AAC.1
MVSAARLYIPFPGMGRAADLFRASTAGGNARRGALAPANPKKPASKPFCFEFAKRSSCARGDNATRVTNANPLIWHLARRHLSEAPADHGLPAGQSWPTAAPLIGEPTLSATRGG